MISGTCDIAECSRTMKEKEIVKAKESGIEPVEFTVALDGLAVVVHPDNPVSKLTIAQLADIFTGKIANWKEEGGPDLAVFVIVPGRDTAANKNFRRQVMKHKEIDHQFEAYNSTMVLEAVKYFPCGAVSVISQGAAIKYEDIQEIKINGLSPNDKDYPYYQIFYYVTKGEQSATVKKFIDFTRHPIGIRPGERH